jgi:GTP cyclohydrolase I
VAGSSIIVVCIPSIVILISINWQHYLISINDHIAIIYVPIGINSIANIIAYFVYREDFDEQITKIMKFYRQIIVRQSADDHQLVSTNNIRLVDYQTFSK